MPVLSKQQIKEVQAAGIEAYNSFLQNKDYKPLQKTGRYSLLGSWLPVLGTIGGFIIGIRKDRESARSFEDKAEAARCMAEFYAAKSKRADAEELDHYKAAYVEAKEKAEASHAKYATTWGTLQGSLNILFDDRKAIDAAGSKAKEDDFSSSKKPFLKTKALPYALLGTLIIPIVGTIVGAVIGSYRDSSSTIRRKQHAELKAAEARYEKAKFLDYKEEDINEFFQDKERIETLYNDRYRRTNATSWGTLFGTLILWWPGAIVGAWTGKYIDKEHNIETKERAAHNAERAKSRINDKSSSQDVSHEEEARSQSREVETAPSSSVNIESKGEVASGRGQSRTHS